MGYRPVTRTEFDYEVYPPTEISRPIVLNPLLCVKGVSQGGVRTFLAKSPLPSGRPGLMIRTPAGVAAGQTITVSFIGKVPRCKKLLWLMEIGQLFGENYDVYEAYLSLYVPYNVYYARYQVDKYNRTFKYYNANGTWVNVPTGYTAGVATGNFRLGQEFDLEAGTITAFHICEVRYPQEPAIPMYVYTGGSTEWKVYLDFNLKTVQSGYQHAIILGPNVFYPLEG
jgi:hypothetical protein